MAVLSTGNTYATGNQVTATNLNAAVNSATFASGAVDDSTTQLSGGAIIVKDGGITSAKLATNISVAGTFSAAGAASFASTLGVTGQLTTGAGGTGNTTAVHTVSGSSASTYGAYTRYQRNSVDKVLIGTTHAVLGVNEDSGAVLASTAFRVGIDGSGTIGNFTSTGLAVTGVISTTDPAGGAGPNWKFGVAASVSPTSPNRTLRVDIGGTSYYIHAKTTND